MKDTQNALQVLLADLPPVIPREKIGVLLGGLYSPKYMAKLDSLGQGPKRFRLGKKVVYGKADLLEWLERRSERI